MADTAMAGTTDASAHGNALVQLAGALVSATMGPSALARYPFYTVGLSTMGAMACITDDARA